MRSNTQRISGFSLIELLFVIAMIGVAFLVTDKVFRASMNSLKQSHDLADNNSSTARLYTVLRRDVWNATALDIPDANHLRLTIAGETVDWELASSIALRSASSPNRPHSQRWAIDGTVSVRRDSGVVTLTRVTKNHTAPDVVRFINPVGVVTEDQP